MKILAAISFALAVAASGLLLVLPTYSGWSSQSPFVQQHATLLQVNGPRAQVAVAIPVLIALIPVLLPKWWVRLVAGVVLGAFVGVAGLFDWTVLRPERCHHADCRFAVSPAPERLTADTITPNILSRLAG